MKQAHLIKQAAILYYAKPKYWSNSRLSERFGVSISTILKWQSSKAWKEIADSFASASEAMKIADDSLFREEHADKLEHWQSLQERLAVAQMSFATKVTGYAMELLDQIKKTEEPSLETLKQIGNFSSLATASCRLRESASEAMNVVLAIETILENIGTEPKQLELDLGNR